jgi:hypothetical protein
MKSLVELAARDNAHVYQRVCGAHGCETLVKESHLICLGQPPRFFSQAVALQPGVGEVIAKEVSGGFKDSFFDIEPDCEVYEQLFEASWIHLSSREPSGLVLEWRQAQNPDQLDEWESGWAEGDDEAAHHPRQFPFSLLEVGDFAFHSAWQGGEMVAGLIFNRSESVVGCSNLWVKAGWLEAVWRDLPSYAAHTHPGIDVVGYERGVDLEFALQAGFEVIGPLRVWVPKG